MATLHCISFFFLLCLYIPCNDDISEREGRRDGGREGDTFDAMLSSDQASSPSATIIRVHICVKPMKSLPNYRER